MAEFIKYHQDGSVWAKGEVVDNLMEGYWEWFRKDGTKMRSGHFRKGQQVGEWITYDKKGQIYKITNLDKSPPKGNIMRKQS